MDVVKNEMQVVGVMWRDRECREECGKEMDECFHVP